MARTVKGKSIYAKDITSNATCQLVVDEGAANIELLKEMTTPILIKFTENNGESIECFGKKLNLPPKTTILNMVTPKISSTKEKYNQGDIINVEWVPSKDFECRIGYSMDIWVGEM